MRLCSSCKKYKPNSEFWFRGGDRGTDLQSECKDCIRKRRKIYRRDTKSKIIKLLGGKCEICGHTSKTGVSLSIDRRVQTVKSLSAKNILQWKWERIQDEIKKGKCWLLCMNCHMEEEEKRRNSKE
jgi:hypothetical protein